MSIGTRSKGTRVFHAALGTTWTALAALATPGAAFIEATCCISVSNPKRFEVQEFDVSCLADPTEQPVQEIKPGSFSFTIKQNEVGATGTGTDALKTLADATTPLVWAILYVDGRCCFFPSGVLIPMSEGDAQNSITDEVKHSYMVRGLLAGVWQTHA